MIHMIESIACLTECRNHDDLELAFATVIFDRVSSAEITLWRLTGHGCEMTLSDVLRLGVPEEPRAACAVHNAVKDRPDLVACRYTRRPLRQQLQPDLFSHLSLILDDSNVGVVLEIRRSTAMTQEQDQIVDGLARIYRNVAGSLDHGERDELTGLLNRRTFDRFFRALADAKPSGGANKIVLVDRRRAGQTEQATHLAVIDVDFFKKVNDRFGHLYGDEVLVLLSRLMSRSFRDADRLFRFGGEEFVVILRAAKPEEAILALERFRVAVEGFPFPQVGTVTVSLGFTTIIRGESGSSAFGRADEALYVAKKQGRNRICCYEALVAQGALSPRFEDDTNITLF